jgi:hypothetical protein
MPADPPRDAAGNIEPHNHAEILDAHHVIRHITPDDLCEEADTGITRVSSGAYSESSDVNGGMSVDIEEWVLAANLDALHYIRDPSYGATRLNVGALRKAGFKVGWDPLPHNPHHGAVWGIGNGSKRKRRVAKLATTIRKAMGED